MWIRVCDQKPPTKEPVVYAVPKGNGRYGVGIAYWTVSEQWNPEIESVRAPQGFTLWMPLPGPDQVASRGDSQ